MPDATELFEKLQAPNMLQQAQGALQLRQLQQNVQSQQREIEARDALGPILQGAIDPKTGEFDFNKYFVGAAANPKTAWKAQEILEKGVALKSTSVETALKELQKSREQAGAIYDGFGGLLPLRNAVTRGDATNVLKDIYEKGQIDKDHYVQALGQLDRLPQSGPALQNYLKQTALRAQGAAKALETTHKEITSRDIGGAEVFVQPDPLSGTVRQAGVLPKTLTPEKKGELVEGIDIDGSLTGRAGSVYKLPYGEVFPSESVAPSGTAGGGGASASGAPPQRFLITGRPPAEQEALKEMGEDYKNLVAAHSSNRLLVSSLDEAEKMLKEYTPSAGADVRERIARGLSAIGVSDEVVNKVANGTLAGGQVFKSVMLDVAAARLRKAVVGQTTNLEWTGYTETKPNQEMTPEAVRELVQYYRKTVKMEDAYLRGYLAHIKPENKKNPLDFQSWWADVVDKVRADSAEGRRKK